MDAGIYRYFELCHLLYLERPANTYKFLHSIKIEGIVGMDDHISLNTRTL